MWREVEGMSEEVRNELSGNEKEDQVKKTEQKVEETTEKTTKEAKIEEAREKVGSDEEVGVVAEAESAETEPAGIQEEPETEEVKETVVEEPRVRRIYFRKKVCRLCTQKIESIDYKDIDLLSRFIADSGKILPRRMTGTCARHQRMLAGAIKRARIAALLPFVSK